jgi:hypothetical protein
VNVEHLDCCQFVQDCPCSYPARERLEPDTQRDVQAIGHECNEDVRFDTLLQLMVDGTQAEIVLKVLEGGLDLDQLDIELPKLGRVSSAQIGAQQVAPFSPADLA